jgi:hypothetical protein
MVGLKLRLQPLHRTLAPGGSCDFSDPVLPQFGQAIEVRDWAAVIDGVGWAPNSAGALAAMTINTRAPRPGAALPPIPCPGGNRPEG